MYFVNPFVPIQPKDDSVIITSNLGGSSASQQTNAASSASNSAATQSQQNITTPASQTTTIPQTATSSQQAATQPQQQQAAAQSAAPSTATQSVTSTTAPTQQTTPNPFVSSKQTQQKSKSKPATPPPIYADPNQVVFPFAQFTGDARLQFTDPGSLWDTFGSTAELKRKVNVATQGLTDTQLKSLAHLAALLMNSSDTQAQQIGLSLRTALFHRGIQLPNQPDLRQAAQAPILSLAVSMESGPRGTNVEKDVGLYLWQIQQRINQYIEDLEQQSGAKAPSGKPTRSSTSARSTPTDWTSYLGPLVGALLGAGLAGLAAPEQNKWIYVLLGALLGGGGGYAVQHHILR